MDSVQQQSDNQNSTQTSTQKYNYRPLTDPTQIRVFTLHPGRAPDPLTGDLQHINLNDPPRYEALSYEWGKADLAQQVLIQTSPDTPPAHLRITQTLHQALRDLRYKDKPRAIWADALCIDQTNLPERAQQVSLMGHVYRSASRVTTYVGADDGTTVLAVSLMYSFLPLLTGASASDLSIPPATDPRVTAFQALVLRGWAGRCWCAQEFLLNADLVMLSGRHEMPWFLVPSIVQLVATHKLPPHLVPQDPLFLRECLSSMFTMRGAMHLGGGYAPSLLELLVLTYPMRATDPRDKIYALLGVAADAEKVGVVVDYTCSVEELYVDVARKLLDVDRTATLLSWNLGTKQFNLPSWVPDWTCWRPGSIDTMVGKAHRAGGSERPKMKVTGGGRRLDVSGAIIDSVEFLSEHVGLLFAEEPTAGDGGNAAAQFLDEMLAQASDLPPYANTVLPAEVLARTLTCDMALNDEPAPENHVESFNAFRASYSSNTDNTTTSPDTVAAHAFRQNVHKRMRYRRLCVTTKRFFGAIPQEAQSGDAICVVEGAKGLCVVRPAARGEENEGEEVFSLVGMAYVHGLMNGEALAGEGYKTGVVVLV